MVNNLVFLGSTTETAVSSKRAQDGHEATAAGISTRSTPPGARMNHVLVIVCIRSTLLGPSINHVLVIMHKVNSARP